MLNDLTKGKPAKIILMFSLPLLLSTAIQQLYNMADSAIVGNLDSARGLACLGAAYPLTLFYVAIATGSAMGCSVVVSRLYGAKKMGDLKSAMYTIVITLTVLGAIIALAGFLLAEPLMHMLGANDEIFEGAKTYISIYALGAFPMLVFNAVSAIFTGVGDAKKPLIFLIISSVLNVALDIIAVGPLQMSVKGAAWATSFSQLVAALLSTFILLKKMKEIDAGDEPVRRFSVPIFRDLVKLSIPSILQQVCVAIGHTVIQTIVNSYDTATIAGYELGAKIVNFIYMCFNTLGTALSSFVGQNLGAGRKDRIKSGFRVSNLICFLMVLFVVGLIQLFAPQLIGLFIKDGESNIETVMAVGIAYVRIVTLDEFVVSQIIPAGGLLRGLGRVNKFFVATIADFAIRVIMSFVLTKVLNSVNGLFWAWYFGSVLDLILLRIFYHYECKKGVLAETVQADQSGSEL